MDVAAEQDRKEIIYLMETVRDTQKLDETASRELARTQLVDVLSYFGT